MYSLRTLSELLGYPDQVYIRDQYKKFVSGDTTCPDNDDLLETDHLHTLLQAFAAKTNKRSARAAHGAKVVLDAIESGKSLTLEDVESCFTESFTLKAEAISNKPFIIVPKKNPEPVVHSLKELPTESNGTANKEILTVNKSGTLQENESSPSINITLKEGINGTFGNFMPVDLVTYLSILVIFISCCSIFPNWVGCIFAAILSVVLLNALFVVKTRRLRDAKGHSFLGVWMVEVISCSLHWSMFYNELESNYSNLPWSFGTEDDTWSYTGLICAVVLCSWSLYAIYNRSAITSASVYAQDFKDIHGKEY